MTRTQYFVAASLDGFIADAAGDLQWLFQFNDVEGVEAHYKAFLAGVGALAMGAATYEFIVGEKPTTWPYAGIPTWVFTHRELLGFAGADIRFTADDVGAVHEQMVGAAGGKHIWLVGGGNLAAQFPPGPARRDLAQRDPGGARRRCAAAARGAARDARAHRGDPLPARDGRAALLGAEVALTPGMYIGGGRTSGWRRTHASRSPRRVAIVWRRSGAGPTPTPTRPARGCSSSPG
ncbi:hypothetical protein OV079_51795 [Nannocystis pusilla]|uniref:Dihydrofolate reductase n=1 Tax=Nannocystis pusilla TaxID=889268 RepID=A0A9X3F1Z2_9BACT|nr:hypothetical protein [Nannocystis pusilla]MCY1013875.1 hypothetical protein [Nannocystis pusilla]